MPSPAPFAPALPSVLDLARMIDHSLLHPTMTDAEILKGCETARRYDVATVCVKPYAVRMSRVLATGRPGCAVAGFPHGNSHPELKIAEAERSIAEGATEIDVVVNIGKVLGGDWSEVSAEIKAVNAACVGRGAILKVIFENDYLQEAHIIRFADQSQGLGRFSAGGIPPYFPADIPWWKTPSTARRKTAQPRQGRRKNARCRARCPWTVSG